MNGFYRLDFILSAALITLAISVELAIIPLLISVSFLQIMLLWGVTAYGILMLSSWLLGDDPQKKKIATGLALIFIIIGTGFIIFILGKFFYR
jgi:hypothetical protein